MEYELVARLSPNGQWLVAVVDEAEPLGVTSFGTRESGPWRVDASNVRVSRSARQWLVIQDLVGEVPPRMLHVARDREERLDDLAIVLDDGTVVCANDGYRLLSRWHPDGTRHDLPLGDVWQQGQLHLQPDGHTALVLHAPDDDAADDDDGADAGADDGDAGWNAFAFDPARGVIEPRPRLRIGSIVGWAGADLVATEGHGAGLRLLRVNVTTGEVTPILDDGWIAGDATSAAWFVWTGGTHRSAGGFWRLAAPPRQAAVRVPALARWRPLAAVDEDRFLCSAEDGARHAIVDVRAERELDAVPGLLSEPIAYTRALDAFVTWRDDRCTIWGRDGVLRREIVLVAP